MIDLIGKPFAYGGRGPQTFDCYGLVMELHRRRGIELPDFRSPKRASEIAALIDGARPLWRQCEEKPNAVVLFRIEGFGAHVGTVIKRPDRFIHTWEHSGGVCIERLSVWQRRIMGFYEYVG